jgi:hypothetical protein
MKSTLKLLSAIAAKMITRVLGYSLLGLIINAVLLYMYWGDITAFLAQVISPQAAAHLSALFLVPIAVVMALFSPETAPAAIAFLSVLVFPVLFFVVGQKQGIQSAIYYVISKQSKSTIAYLLQHLNDKYPGLMKKSIDTHALLIEKFAQLSNPESTIPKPLKLLVAHLAERVNSATIISNTLNGLAQEEHTNAELIEKIATNISVEIEQLDMEPSLHLPVLVIALNILIPSLSFVLIPLIAH